MATKFEEKKSFVEQEKELDSLKETNLKRLGEIDNDLRDLQKSLGEARMKAQSTAPIHAKIKAIQGDKAEIESEIEALNEAIQVIRDEATVQRVQAAKEKYIAAGTLAAKKSIEIFATVEALVTLLFEYQAAAQERNQAGGLIQNYGISPSIDPEAPVGNALAIGIAQYLDRLSYLPQKSMVNIHDRVSRLASKIRGLIV